MSDQTFTRTVEVKICGLTNQADARHALACGADYLGFVLYAGSPRGITPGAMRRILDGLGGTARAVAVFVNENAAVVRKVAEDCGLYAAQTHGDEDPAEFAALPVPVWRAVRMENGVWRPDPGAWPAERYLVDASVPGAYGGTGVAADWDAAARLARSAPLMLAGGLTPENVAEAVRLVRPLGVDVVSGVEASPGRKDPVKVRRFISEAKACGIPGATPPGPR
ncbi:MAG: phosphoribosylanthranilate isomerase [Lentisphaerae bacterium]|nr:phosphoribosylanthranilate isomerase [Lentisphaerota bacterium]